MARRMARHPNAKPTGPYDRRNGDGSVGRSRELGFEPLSIVVRFFAGQLACLCDESIQNLDRFHRFVVAEFRRQVKASGLHNEICRGLIVHALIIPSAGALIGYACPDCGHVFEKLVLSRSAKAPECPKCGRDGAEQIFPPFATASGKGMSSGMCAPSGGG